MAREGPAPLLPASAALSRQTVSPAMARRGMRSAAELAADKPCGTRLRYYAGCRCAACKRANSLYECERHRAKARGESNGIVSAEAARKHLAWLSSRGVGRKTAADAAKVPSSTISLIIDGERNKIRHQTERRILAVTEAAAADRALVDGSETWRMLDELMASGYTKARIATEMYGRLCKSLQMDRGRVTARSADRVRRAYDVLRLADPQTATCAQGQIGALREEHYRLEWIQGQVNALAAAREWPAPSISHAPQRGRWPSPPGITHRAALLIDVVHARLLGDVDAPALANTGVAA